MNYFLLVTFIIEDALFFEKMQGVPAERVMDSSAGEFPRN